MYYYIKEKFCPGFHDFSQFSCPGFHENQRKACLCTVMYKLCLLTSDTTYLSPITLEIPRYISRILFSRSNIIFLPEVSFAVSFIKSNFILVTFKPAFHVYPGAEYEYSGLIPKVPKSRLLNKVLKDIS